MPCHAMQTGRRAGQSSQDMAAACLHAMFLFSLLLPSFFLRLGPCRPHLPATNSNSNKQHPAFGLQDKLPRALPNRKKENPCGSLSNAPPLGHCCIPIRGGGGIQSRPGKKEKGQANNRLQHEATNSSLFWLSIPKTPVFPPLRRDDGRPTMTLVASQQAEDAGTITNLLGH